MPGWVSVVLCGLVAIPLLWAGQAHAQAEDDWTAEEIRQRLEEIRGLTFEAVDEDEAEGENGVDIATEYDKRPVDERLDIRIKFDFDSAVIRDDQETLLKALCDGIGDADVGRIRIVGHTDASGTAAYNASLSKLRAEEVERHLVGRCDLDASRFEAIGVGEEHLLEGIDPRGEENRRVEFQPLG